MDRFRLRQVMYHIYSIHFTSIKETPADTAHRQVNIEKTQRTSMKQTIKQPNSSQAKQTNKQDRCYLQSSRIFENVACDDLLFLYRLLWTKEKPSRTALSKRPRFQKFSYTVCRPVFDQWVFNKLVLKPSSPKMRMMTAAQEKVTVRVRAAQRP